MGYPVLKDSRRELYLLTTDNGIEIWQQGYGMNAKIDISNKDASFFLQQILFALAGNGVDLQQTKLLIQAIETKKITL